MTVYIINKALHDFSAAKEYGPLVFLSKTAINRYATNNIYRQFNPILAKSKSTDHILITALNTMNIIACVIFAFKHKCLNLLIHKAKGNSYIERKLDFKELL